MDIKETTALALIADIEQGVVGASQPDLVHEATRAGEQLHGIARLLIRACGGEDEAERVIAEINAAQDRIEAMANSHRVTPRSISRPGAGILR